MLDFHPLKLLPLLLLPVMMTGSGFCQENVIFDQFCCADGSRSGCGFFDNATFFECSDADDFLFQSGTVIGKIEIQGLYDGDLNDQTHQGVTVRIWSDSGMLPNVVVWQQTFPDQVSVDGTGSFEFDVNIPLGPGIFWLQVLVNASGVDGSWQPLYAREEDNYRGTLATEGIETFGAWVSRTDSPGLVFRLSGRADPVQGPKRMVPHVTVAGGSFSTNVILANTSGTSRTYQMTAYNQSGSQVGSAAGSLEADTTLFSDPQTLFANQDVSHFEISDASNVKVSIAYQANTPGSGPAHVNESAYQSDSWRLFPGNAAVTWDGIAVVNTGASATDVHVIQRDGAGTMLADKTAIVALAPNAKGLYVISDQFTRVEDGFFEICADQPLALTALRGNLASDFLWENNNVPDQGDNRLIPHITRAAGSFLTRIILTNTSATQRSFSLTGSNQQGELIAGANGTVPAGGALFQTVEELFDTSEVSHFSIGNGSPVGVTITYQANKNGGGPAHVGSASNLSQKWRIYPGNWAVTWDGFAVVNRGNSATSILVTQYAADGTPVETKTAVVLTPDEKGLYVISTEFSPVVNSYFEISADQPLAITALRGNQASDFLWENRAIAGE